ncbi:hypothetical protein, partial [Megasphaera massiliensis]|uniref:hypothetical protein n=1 Tax=Megasphaera massiliensis TaxID=1232428 RepID=UPI001D08BF69
MKQTDKAELQKDYEHVKELIRKKKRKGLMRDMLLLVGCAVVLYCASYVWKRLTLYPITKSE